LGGVSPVQSAIRIDRQRERKSVAIQIHLVQEQLQHTQRIEANIGAMKVKGGAMTDTFSPTA
jgi:hypothetical protein